MKKNIFWIISGFLFIALIGLYIVFVSNARESLSKDEKAKKDAITKLETCVNRATSGDLVSDATRASIKSGVDQLKKQVNDIESFLKDIQKDFIYVKGVKEWKYVPQESLEYKSWYNKKKDELYLSLMQSGFVFENDGNRELNAADIDRNKEKMGFKTWGSDTPTEKEIYDAQQQLSLMAVIIDAITPLFKTQKNVYPILQKVSFDSWMEPDPINNVLRSKATLRIDCPFSFVNQLMSELEKTKIHLKVENIEVMKKANVKDYIEFPNVSIVLSLSFQIFNDKKVKQ